MKKITLLILVLMGFFFHVSCSKGDSDDLLKQQLIGKKYAHLLVETEEECREIQEHHLFNCAQILEILDEHYAEFMVTDILYRMSYAVSGDKLILKSADDTYEVREDLIFRIENPDHLVLTYNDTDWRAFEDSFWE